MPGRRTPPIPARLEPQCAISALTRVPSGLPGADGRRAPRACRQQSNVHPQSECRAPAAAQPAPDPQYQERTRQNFGPVALFARDREMRRRPARRGLLRSAASTVSATIPESDLLACDQAGARLARLRTDCDRTSGRRGLRNHPLIPENMPLRALKILVIVMGIMLVVGFAALILVIARPHVAPRFGCVSPSPSAPDRDRNPAWRACRGDDDRTRSPYPRPRVAGRQPPDRRYRSCNRRPRWGDRAALSPIA